MISTPQMMDTTARMIVISLFGTALIYKKFLMPSRIRMIPIVIQNTSTNAPGMVSKMTPKTAITIVIATSMPNRMPSALRSRSVGTKIRIPSTIRNAPVSRTSMIMESAG